MYEKKILENAVTTTPFPNTPTSDEASYIKARTGTIKIHSFFNTNPKNTLDEIIKTALRRDAESVLRKHGK